MDISWRHRRTSAATLTLATAFVALTAAVLYAAAHPPIVLGDFCEYGQMTEGLGNHGSP
jgi:hypothetical protein